MRKQTITAEQLDRLIRDVMDIPPSPEGDHVSDDTFLGYSSVTLAPDELDRADRHLASCSQCASQMEHLIEASLEWATPEGEARVARLRETITQAAAVGPTVADIIRAVVASFRIPIAFAAAGASHDQWKSGEDGRFKYTIRRLPERGLIIDITTDEKGLEGRIVEVRYGGWSASDTFTTGFAGQLRASVAVDSSAAKGWGEDVTLMVEVLEATGASNR